MSLPLQDTLIISIEQAIAAPYCSRLLADLGARVIKVERPDGGDFARGYDTRARGLSSHFVWTNRSKESLALDLKDEAAITVLKTLLAKADVFIQNLAPGAAARLGLGHEQLAKAFPQLITCSISGYGTGGPDSQRKAYDLLIQAEAGLLSVTGSAEQPAKCGISIADISAGTTACNAILAALINRGKTGSGDHIEVSMLEAMAEWMGFPMYFASDGAEPPTRAGAGHATIFPYGPYNTADGTIMLGLQNDREWKAFCCEVLQNQLLAEDTKFHGNDARYQQRDEINSMIDQVLKKLPNTEAITRLEKAGIGTASVNSMAGLWNHRQLKARERWQQIQTPTGPQAALKPVSGNAWQPQMAPVPALGEHTQSILKELNIADHTIAQLSKTKAT